MRYRLIVPEGLMIAKIRNYDYSKIVRIITDRPTLVELFQILTTTVTVTVVMLMITHLLISGEFGFCWWSAERGWLWKNLIG